MEARSLAISRWQSNVSRQGYKLLLQPLGAVLVRAVIHAASVAIKISIHNFSANGFCVYLFIYIFSSTTFSLLLLKSARLLPHVLRLTSAQFPQTGEDFH